MMYLFPRKHHVDIWGTHAAAYLWSLFEWSEFTFVYVFCLLLFMLYCGSMYTSSLSKKYPKKQYYQMQVVYKNVFRGCFGYDRFSSESQMFVEIRTDNFGACMSRLIYGYCGRLHASENCLVACLVNSATWSNPKLCQKWGKFLYKQSCLN